MQQQHEITISLKSDLPLHGAKAAELVEQLLKAGQVDASESHDDEDIDNEDATLAAGLSIEKVLPTSAGVPMIQVDRYSVSGFAMRWLVAQALGWRDSNDPEEHSTAEEALDVFNWQMEHDGTKVFLIQLEQLIAERAPILKLMSDFKADISYDQDASKESSRFVARLTPYEKEANFYLVGRGASEDEALMRALVLYRFPVDPFVPSVILAAG